MTKGLSTVAVVGVLAALVAGGAGATTSAKAAVPQGIGAAVLPATAFGTTPASTPERVSFILDARNEQLLESEVDAGMPGGFLSVGQFAAQFGQPQSNVRALEAYLAHYGITSRALADGLDVETQGTAGQYDNALSVQQSEFQIAAIPARDGHPGRPGKTIHGTKQSPLLPRDLAQFVHAILGLTDYPTSQSEAQQVPGGKNTVQTGDLTPADFAKHYDLDPVYREGASGQGRTIGIVTLASMDPSVAQTFWSSILGIKTKPNRISLVNVDGGSGPISDASGSGESTLDVEESGGLAPNANIVVYQAPNTDYGFVDGFFEAASDNTADSVSSSWGESETAVQATVNAGQEDANYATSFDEAYLELAAQGQTAFTSSGDFGAYTPFEDVGSTNLGVGNPDDSPWVTDGGGTTLAGTIPLGAELAGPFPIDPNVRTKIPAERTWGWDWIWPFWRQLGFDNELDAAKTFLGGTGGGFSVLEPMAGYQSALGGDVHSFSAVQYLTPTDFQTVDGLDLPFDWTLNPNPRVTRGGAGNGRGETDIATDADPFTGYEFYFTFGDQPATLETGWGGTSFVAPQLNGSTAVIESLLGRRIGFLNPIVYRLAQLRNSPFTPLDTPGTSNDNLFYTGTPGHIWNPGSGLGTPDLARLAGDLGLLR